jgi:hypothetical protein
MRCGERCGSVGRFLPHRVGSVKYQFALFDRVNCGNGAGLLLRLVAEATFGEGKRSPQV